MQARIKTKTSNKLYTFILPVNYVYIYICGERERDIYTYIYIGFQQTPFIYIYIYIQICKQTCNKLSPILCQVLSAFSTDASWQSPDPICQMRRLESTKAT